MMQGSAFRFWRIAAPVALALSLALAFVPSAFAAPRAASPALVGPKAYYMALGDSLAFGFQPDLDFTHGYSNYFYSNLKSHGVTDYDNLACPGETTTTMINGDCPYPYLRKYLYVGSQLTAAVNYLHKHAGQVSPVTLTIGANDVNGDFNSSTCTVSASWSNDLATMDHNLTQTILPQLAAAMTVNGHLTGDLLLTNYYDPYENECPNTVSYIQTLNAHLAADAAGFATLVDVFDPFGGTTVPNPNLCNETWICSIFKDIHSKDAGYSLMASALEQAAGY
jgi:lysophospholipase L1-like esterase